MSSQIVAGGLSGRIAGLLPRLSYKRAVDAEYRARVFRLRHDAYLKEGAITPQAGAIFTDPVDEAGNTYLFGIHVDGVLMSSIRISIGTLDTPSIPTAVVFPELLQPELEAGRVVVDPTRFVVDAASSRSYPELPYVTLRLAWMAAEHFEGDLLLAAVRPEHTAFYRRFWSSSVVASARLYPLLTKPVALTASEVNEVREQVHARYPFMRSTVAERDEVFGPPSSVHPVYRAPTAEVHSGAVR
jgi:hypothetical protein